MKTGNLSELGRICRECGIIIDGIPEGAISRKVGLIWGIPANSSPVSMLWSLTLT